MLLNNENNQSLKVFLSSIDSQEAICEYDRTTALFLAKSIGDFFNFLFEKPTTKEGKNAFLLLTFPNEILIETISKSSTLIKKIGNILSDEKSSERSINRVCSLLSLLIRKSPKIIVDNFNNIKTLLELHKLTTAKYFFQDLFDDESSILEAQQHILKSGLMHIIIKQLNENNDNDVLSFHLKILFFISKNKKLSETYFDADIISSIVELNDKCFLITDYWELLTEILRTTKSDELDTLIDVFTFKILKLKGNLKVLTFILNFMSEMIAIKPDKFDSFIQNGKHFDFLMDIAFEKDEFSALKNSIFRFFTSCLTNRKYRLNIVNVILPTILKTATSKSRSSLAANSIIFVMKLSELSETDRRLRSKLVELSEYREITINYLPQYKKLLINNYGGGMCMRPNGFALKKDIDLM